MHSHDIYSGYFWQTFTLYSRRTISLMSRTVHTLKSFRSTMKFIDIGANLTDGMFQGLYNGNQKHPSDLDVVLERSWAAGMQKIIITVGTIADRQDALAIAQKDDRLYLTMGCHPTRCMEFAKAPDEYYAQLCEAIETHRNKIVAIGECGLDYDRLKFCPADVQRIYFEQQLDLVAKYHLPLFLHCRNSFDDFYDIVQRNAGKITNGGVVHSFDGTLEQAMKCIEFGFSIGINGCSLKTEKQMQVVAQIPNDKILVETDCPWCAIRPSHAGTKYIKTKLPMTKKKEKWSKDTLIDGRYEPAQIVQVLEVIAGCKNANVNELAEQFYQNTVKLFFQ